MSDYDVDNLLGDRKPEWNPGKKKRPTRQGPTPETTTRPTQRTEWKANNGIYDHLATVFRDTPVYVMQGAPLIAKLLRERVQGDRSLTQRLGTPPGESKPRDEHVVQDLVEHMIKRFWATVPNDQRTDAMRAFLKDEWWIPLAEEAVNHLRLSRIDDAPASPGGPAALDDPFYADFIAAKRRHPAGKSLRQRLEIARTHHEQESN